MRRHRCQMHRASISRTVVQIEIPASASPTIMSSAKMAGAVSLRLSTTEQETAVHAIMYDATSSRPAAIIVAPPRERQE